MSRQLRRPSPGRCVSGARRLLKHRTRRCLCGFGFLRCCADSFEMFMRCSWRKQLATQTTSEERISEVCEKGHFWYVYTEHTYMYLYISRCLYFVCMSVLVILTFICSSVAANLNLISFDCEMLLHMSSEKCYMMKVLLSLSILANCSGRYVRLPMVPRKIFVKDSYFGQTAVH